MPRFRAAGLWHRGCGQRGDGLHRLLRLLLRLRLCWRLQGRLLLSLLLLRLRRNSIQAIQQSLRKAGVALWRAGQQAVLALVLLEHHGRAKVLAHERRGQYGIHGVRHLSAAVAWREEAELAGIGGHFKPDTDRRVCRDALRRMCCIDGIRF